MLKLLCNKYGFNRFRTNLLCGTHYLILVAQVRPPNIQRLIELYKFDSQANINNSLICASDCDHGGDSSANISLIKETDTEPYAARLSGSLSLHLNQNKKNLHANLEVGGFAGMRTKKLPFTLFSSKYHKLYPYSCIHVAVRNNDISKSWKMNILAPISSPLDLFQYPLRFTSTNWHYFQIPFRNFILTRLGNKLVHQSKMPKDAIQSIGFSIVKQPGPFSLDVAWINATNPLGRSDEELELAINMATNAGNEDEVKQLKAIYNEHNVNL